MKNLVQKYSVRVKWYKLAGWIVLFGILGLILFSPPFCGEEDNLDPAGPEQVDKPVYIPNWAKNLKSPHESVIIIK